MTLSLFLLLLLSLSLLLTTEGWNTPKYSLSRWFSHKVHHWASILRFLPNILFVQSCHCHCMVNSSCSKRVPLTACPNFVCMGHTICRTMIQLCSYVPGNVWGELSKFNEEDIATLCQYQTYIKVQRGNGKWFIRVTKSPLMLAQVFSAVMFEEFSSWIEWILLGFNHSRFSWSFLLSQGFHLCDHIIFDVWFQWEWRVRAEGGSCKRL